MFERSRAQDRSLKITSRGQAMALMAVTLTMLLGIAALAVDVGFFMVTRNELQNAADGAALAATRALGNVYQGLSYEEQQGYTCDGGCISVIEATAQEVGQANEAFGEAVDILIEDVIIGQWDGDNFTPTLIQPDAVQVITRRDEAANGPISTFFAQTMGIDEGIIRAHAIAALTGQGTTVEGEVELPIGISRWFFDSQPNAEFCDDQIQFYPTNDPASCAGWTSWDLGSNDITLRRILQELDGYESPEIIAGETDLFFTGGTLSDPTFDDLLSLFQEKGWDTDSSYNYLVNSSGNRVKQTDPDIQYYVYDEEGDMVPVNPAPMMELDNQGVLVQSEYPDGTPRYMHKWETTVPVYDRGDCSNPNQTIVIVGFAPIELRDVLNAPNKLVRGIVKCEYVDEWPNRGGGGNYGIKGSVPGLVR